MCFVVCGDESLGSEPHSLHYCQDYMFHGAGEKSRVCSADEANKSAVHGCHFLSSPCITWWHSGLVSS